MASYLVQETDGTSKFLLEDSSGSILLETSVAGGGSFTNLLLLGIGVLAALLLAFG